MNEFEIIERYFKPLTGGKGDARDLKDDAAVLSVPTGYELVVTSDTLNAGTHFLDNAAPGDIARKALRVNVSDVLAMGAQPYAYQLNIAFPKPPSEAWLKDFTQGLYEDQEHYSIFCSGGDTTRINGPLSISITAFGLVPQGRAVARGGGKPGDRLFLTGPVGDAWVGLQLLRGALDIPFSEDKAYFIERYQRPKPKKEIIPLLQGYASAAIDVSDGLIADLGHLAGASGLQAEIGLTDTLPISRAAQDLIIRGDITPQDLLSGGDDYELLFAVPTWDEGALLKEAGQMDLALYPLGCLFAGNGPPGKVDVYDRNRQPLDIQKGGWTHF